jgi:hypothetical protein
MKGNRLFTLACCGLGLMAFSQLLIAGMALAVRVEEGRVVRIVEKEVEKLVPIRISVPVAAARHTRHRRSTFGDSCHRGAKGENRRRYGSRHRQA